MVGGRSPAQSEFVPGAFKQSKVRRTEIRKCGDMYAKESGAFLFAILTSYNFSEGLIVPRPKVNLSALNRAGL